MYYDYSQKIYLKSQYTNDDKKYLIEVIEEMITLSEQVRREGVLSIDEEAVELEEDYKKFLMKTLLDGVPSKIQFAAGSNAITTTRVEGLGCRKMMLYNTGIAMISDGESPTLVKMVLYSMLGEIKYTSVYDYNLRSEK